MSDTITTIYFFALALISFALATISIVWLIKVRKHLSTLGKIVLEFEDIGRTIQAADKTESFESRIAGCESKADESQNKLVEYETATDEIASKVRQIEEIIKNHAVELANISEKAASFEELENNMVDKLNQTANKNEAELAEVVTSVNALKDKIETLEKFSTVVQKTLSIIQAAFTDIHPGASTQEDMRVSSETATPEQASRFSQDEQKEAANQQSSETEAYHYP